MNVKLISYTPDMEKIIYLAGRRCYSNEGIEILLEKLDSKRVGDFIKARIKEGHDSILEHGVFTFAIEEVSRALLAQLTRHRIASYSVKSQRYNLEDNFSFVIPESIRNNYDALNIYEEAMDFCQHWYERLIGLGIPKEDARYILPNAATTKLIWTINCRSLRNFLKLRLDIHAQREIRELAEKILEIVKNIAPNVFFDF